MQRYAILDVLENEESKAFIVKHLEEDVDQLALKYTGESNIDYLSCFALIKLYAKCKKKLPTFAKRTLALTDRAFQQSTSERVARFKSEIMEGKLLIDLTGGLGVDDLYLQKSFERVVSYDVDEELNAMVNFNHRALNIDRIERRQGYAEDQSLEGADWVYIDPDRRVKHSKAIGIDQMVPDLNRIIPKAMKIGARVAVKLSPLFEIKEIWRIWPQAYSVYVISEAGDVKEILVLLDAKGGSKTVHAVNVGSKPYHYFSVIDEDRPNIHGEMEVSRFIYLPSSALVKSGLDRNVISEISARQLPGFSIFHGAEPVDINGLRCMEVLFQIEPSLKKIKRELKGLGIERISVSLKGSKESPLSVIKSLGLKEGGDHLLVIIQKPYKMAILCKSLS